MKSRCHTEARDGKECHREPETESISQGQTVFESQHLDKHLAECPLQVMVMIKFSNPSKPFLRNLSVLHTNHETFIIL